MNSLLSSTFPEHRRTKLLAALRSNRAAIDLASIMVGVLVIGVIAGVIAVAVFAVIPWSQNEASKGSLQSVQLAESVAKVKGTDTESPKYLPYDKLIAGKLIGSDRKVSVATDAAGSCYVAAAKSPTGDIYIAEASSPDMVLWDASTETDCDALTAALAGLPEDAAGAPSAGAEMWKTVAIPGFAATSVKSSPSGKTLLASDGYSAAFVSADGGTSFAQLPTSPAGAGAKFLVTGDDKTIFAWGGGQYAKTSDLGATWDTVGMPGVAGGKTIRSVSDNGSVITVTTKDTVFQSTDGGANWAALTVPAACMFNGWVYVDFISANGQNIMCGPQASTELWKTNDAGANWTQATLPGGQMGIITASGDAETVMHQGYDGVASISADGGMTWKPVSAPNAGNTVPAEAGVLDSGKVWSSDGSKSLYISDVGGNSWGSNLASALPAARKVAGGLAPASYSADGTKVIVPDTEVNGSILIGTFPG